jgi:hypothetical protein
MGEPVTKTGDRTLTVNEVRRLEFAVEKSGLQFGGIRDAVLQKGFSRNGT